MKETATCRLPWWSVATASGIAIGWADQLASVSHPFQVRTIPFALLFYATWMLGLHTVFRTLFWAWGDQPAPRRRAIWAWWSCLGLVALLFSLIIEGQYLSPGLLRSSVFWGSLIGLAAAGVWASRRIGDAPWRRSFAPELRRTLTAVIVASCAAYPLGLLSTWIGPATTPFSSGSPDAPNLVLISIDALRGDHIHALGYPRPITPHIDELVDQATTFTRAYVQFPASAPSHASMLTGLPPLAHQVLGNTDVLSEEVITVAERLRDRGYATAAFLDNYFLSRRFGFDQGFETFVNRTQVERIDHWLPTQHLRNLTLYQAYFAWAHPPERIGDHAVEDAIDWLNLHRNGSFFLFLHLIDPHTPYSPPLRFLQAHAEAGDRPPSSESEFRRRVESLSPEDRAMFSRLYDAEVASADDKVGRLLEALSRDGLRARTLVVLTADHGEVLDEGPDTYTHGSGSEGDLHVPLLLSWPETIGAPRLETRPVAATAWLPTALERLGVDFAPYEELSPWASPLRPPWPPAVHALSPQDRRFTAIAVGQRYKLFLDAGLIHRFYDLQEDPGERHNLWPTQSPAILKGAEELSSGLNDWLESTYEARVVPKRWGQSHFDEATRSLLRSLGYL